MNEGLGLAFADSWTGRSMSYLSNGPDVGYSSALTSPASNV